METGNTPDPMVALQEKYDKLRAAVQAAGFGIMETSGTWSIHDQSPAAKKAEQQTLEIIRQNSDLHFTGWAVVSFVETYFTKETKLFGLVQDLRLALNDEPCNCHDCQGQGLRADGQTCHCIADGCDKRHNRETYIEAKPVVLKTVERLREEIQHLRIELAELQIKLAKAQLAAAGDYWIWQNDGTDYPETLTCPILLRPEQLLELLAAAAPQKAEK